MSRRSKLDEVKDQVLEWARQGKETRQIKALLKERGIEISHVTVANNIKKWMEPTLNRINRAVEIKLGNVEEAMDKVLSLLQTIESTEADDWTPGMTFKLKALGEWFDRFARLRGLYPRDGGVHVAVQVNQALDFKKRLWEALNPDEEEKR